MERIMNIFGGETMERVMHIFGITVLILFGLCFVYLAIDLFILDPRDGPFVIAWRNAWKEGIHNYYEKLYSDKNKDKK
jgi:hypothetical protein